MRTRWGKERVGGVGQSSSLISGHCHNSHHCVFQQEDGVAGSRQTPQTEKPEGCIPSADTYTTKCYSRHLPHFTSCSVCETFANLREIMVRKEIKEQLTLFTICSFRIFGINLYCTGLANLNPFTMGF